MSRSGVADPPQPPADERPRRRPQPPPDGGPPRWKTWLPIALGVGLLVLGVLLGLVAWKMVRDRSSFGDALVTTLVNVPSPQAAFGKDRIYVLLLGLDYDYTDTDQPFSGHSRTDTIMVAGLDFPAKAMKLVSVLRDTDAMINGTEKKINEAYVAGGVQLSDKVIGDFVGLPPPVSPSGRRFDRYVIVNSGGLKDFINAIGGIDVPVTEQMDYDDNWGHLHIHFKPGLRHMNGTDAMGYSRFRHDACSDPCRTKRQQQVIHLAIAKLKAQKFNDLLHVGQLIAVLNRNVRTNLTFDEEKSLAWSFKDANTADLGHAETIPYLDTKTTPYGGEVVLPDEKAKAKILADLFGPYGNVTPPPAAALAAIRPATIHLIVQNGSGEPGLATTAAARLQKAGYVIDSVGNADVYSYEATQIRPASRVALVGERVRKDLGLEGAAVIPATDATPGPRTIVTVIVGKDFGLAPAPAVAPTSSVAPLHH